MAQLVANVDLQVRVTDLSLDNLENDRRIFSPRKIMEFCNFILKPKKMQIIPWNLIALDVKGEPKLFANLICGELKLYSILCIPCTSKLRESNIITTYVESVYSQNHY